MFIEDSLNSTVAESSLNSDKLGTFSKEVWVVEKTSIQDKGKLKDLLWNSPVGAPGPPLRGFFKQAIWLGLLFLITELGQLA